jgi:hypothetical protein
LLSFRAFSIWSEHFLGFQGEPIYSCIPVLYSSSILPYFFSQKTKRTVKILLDSSVRFLFSNPEYPSWPPKTAQRESQKNKPQRYLFSHPSV